MKSSAVLSPAERAVLHNDKKSKIVSVLQDARVQEIVKSFGRCTSPNAPQITLEDGTVVIPTIAEEIVYNALMQEKEHSRGFQTLLDMQKVMGETKEEVNINVSLVDADLMKRAID